MTEPTTTDPTLLAALRDLNELRAFPVPETLAALVARGWATPDGHLTPRGARVDLDALAAQMAAPRPGSAS